MYDFYLKFCVIIWRENNNLGSCFCIVVVLLFVFLVFVNLLWNMDLKIGLLIDSMNLWVGICCLILFFFIVLGIINFMLL